MKDFNDYVCGQIEKAMNSNSKISTAENDMYTLIDSLLNKNDAEKLHNAILSYYMLVQESCYLQGFKDSAAFLTCTSLND